MLEFFNFDDTFAAGFWIGVFFCQLVALFAMMVVATMEKRRKKRELWDRINAVLRTLPTPPRR